VQEAEARAQKVLAERGEAATEADRREEQLRATLKQRGRQVSELEAHFEVERAASSEVDARVRSLQQDKGSLQEAWQEATRDVEDLKTLLRAALGKERQGEGLLQKLAGVVAEQKVQLGRLGEQKRLLAAEKVDWTQRDQEALLEREGLEAQRLEVKAEAARLREACEVLRAEVRDGAEVVAKAQSEVDKVRGLRDRVTQLEAECDTSGVAVQVKNRMLDDQNGSLSDLRAQVEELEAACKAWEREEDRLRDELDAARDGEATAQRSEEEAVEERAASRTRYRKELEDKDETLREMTAKYEEKKEVVAYVEKEVEAMQRLFADKEETQRVKSRDATYKLETEIMVLSDEVIRANTELETARSDSLEWRGKWQAAEAEAAAGRHKITETEAEMRELLRDFDKRKKAALQLAQCFETGS
jgi:chromosome segregation ATPase